MDNFEDRLHALTDGPIWEIISQIENPQKQLAAQKTIEELISLAKEEHSKQLKVSQEHADCGNTANQQSMIEELSKARDQAQTVSRLKSEFVANISHEIRTPMNGILGMVEMLLRSELSTSAREYAMVLRETGKSLLSILNDILDFSKIEAGGLQISNCEFDLASLIEGVGDILSPQSETKNLLLTTFIDPHIPALVVGDPLRLRQILLNLSGNAIKFTHQGSVTIRADLLKKFDDKATIRFAVVDTGIGIEEADQEKLFEPFVQVDGSICRRYGGTGLGLSISKRLIEMLGGSIAIDSTINVGSSFAFVITLNTANLSTASKITNSFQIDAAKSLVLILDDDQQLKDCLTKYSSCFGFKTASCSTVSEAVAFIDKARSDGDAITVIVDAARHSQKALELFEREFYGRETDSQRIFLLTTKDHKHESEALLPTNQVKALVKPVRRNALKYCLNTPIKNQLEAAAPQRSNSPRKLNAAQHKLKALVADDNKLNQQVAKLLLQSLNLDVEIVENGMEAVATFDSGNFDFVFLDCQMPVLDGYAAARIIKRLQEQKETHVPIIAMTANVREGSREACLEAGMDDYVAKPIEPAVLEKKLRAWTTEQDKIFTQSNLLKTCHDQASNNQPLIEIETLSARFSEKNYKQLLTMFADTAADEVETLQNHLEKADYKAVRAAAHAFKGACGTICAPSLAKALEELEKAANLADLSQCTALLARLDAGVKQAMEETKGICH
ncbi:hypothetical protein BH11CYA1_BH11CYA1_13590 [soil metagenome]